MTRAHVSEIAEFIRAEAQAAAPPGEARHLAGRPLGPLLDRFVEAKRSHEALFGPAARDSDAVIKPDASLARRAGYTSGFVAFVDLNRSTIARLYLTMEAAERRPLKETRRLWPPAVDRRIARSLTRFVDCGALVTILTGCVEELRLQSVHRVAARAMAPIESMSLHPDLDDVVDIYRAATIAGAGEARELLTGDDMARPLTGAPASQRAAVHAVRNALSRFERREALRRASGASAEFVESVARCHVQRSVADAAVAVECRSEAVARAVEKFGARTPELRSLVAGRSALPDDLAWLAAADRAMARRREARLAGETYLDLTDVREQADDSAGSSPAA